MPVSGIGISSFTYSYKVSVYSVSVSATQGATSIPSETTNPAPETAPAEPVSRDQFRSDLTTLFQAVKSGDMDAAKKALETVQADRPELFDANLKLSGRKAALQSDFQSLVSAVQSGDATAAQGALTRMQSDVQGGHGHHHHRRHHDGAGATTTPPPVSALAPGAGSTTSATAAEGGDTDGDGDSH